MGAAYFIRNLYQLTKKKVVSKCHGLPFMALCNSFHQSSGKFKRTRVNPFS